jgi:putative membrane protein
MHNGNWNDGMGSGNWWWIPMIIMMVAFWGAVIWLGVALVRRNQTPQLHAPGATSMLTPSKPSAQEILAERLARGEVEPDEYRQRLDALQ